MDSATGLLRALLKEIWQDCVVEDNAPGSDLERRFNQAVTVDICGTCNEFVEDLQVHNDLSHDDPDEDNPLLPDLHAARQDNIRLTEQIEALKRELAEVQFRLEQQRNQQREWQAKAEALQHERDDAHTALRLCRRNRDALLLAGAEFLKELYGEVAS